MFNCTEVPRVKTRGYKMGRADGPFEIGSFEGRSPDSHCNKGF